MPFCQQVHCDSNLLVEEFTFEKKYETKHRNTLNQSCVKVTDFSVLHKIVQQLDTRGGL